MISGTNADCKIVGISVSGTIATITLVVFATVATYPSKPFSFAVQDVGSETRKYISNNVYWIDRNNNYDNDSKNVDTNKYKEIILTLDITNGYEADIDDWKWIRKCSILMLDKTKSRESVAWSSGVLTLVSDAFDVPAVTNIGFSDEDTAHVVAVDRDMTHIGVSFDLKYASKSDFSYDASNIRVFVRFASARTDRAIEEKEVVIGESLHCKVVSDEFYDFRVPIAICISVCDMKKRIHSTYRKICRPFRKRSDTFVKTPLGIRKANAIFVHTDPVEEHEGEWLWR